MTGIPPGMVKGTHGRFASALPLRERLLSRLIIDPGTGCLLWTGALNADGYGCISVGQRHMRLVHRVMWELFEKPIPDGMELDHVKDRGCTNRHCASIAHLEPVTHRVNLKRSSAPRKRKAASHA